MLPILQNYFSLLNSNDFSTINESVLVICSLLEIHSWKLSLEARRIRYDYIADEVVNLQLNDSQLTEIVKYICEEVLHPLLINNNRQTLPTGSLNRSIIFGMIRCLEESPANIGLIPTLGLFISCSKVINYEIYKWLVSALGKLVLLNYCLSIIGKQKILVDTNPIPFMKERLLELYSESETFSSHTDLINNIESLIDAIEKIINYQH